MNGIIIAQIDVYDERWENGTLQAVMESGNSDLEKVTWLQNNCACDPCTQDLDLEFGEIIIDIPGYQVYYFDYGMSEGLKLYKL